MNFMITTSEMPQGHGIALHFLSLILRGYLFHFCMLLHMSSATSTSHQERRKFSHYMSWARKGGWESECLSKEKTIVMTRLDQQ